MKGNCVLLPALRSTSGEQPPNELNTQTVVMLLTAPWTCLKRFCFTLAKGCVASSWHWRFCISQLQRCILNSYVGSWCITGVYFENSRVIIDTIIDPLLRTVKWKYQTVKWNKIFWISRSVIEVDFVDYWLYPLCFFRAMTALTVTTSQCVYAHTFIMILLLSCVMHVTWKRGYYIWNLKLYYELEAVLFLRHFFLLRLFFQCFEHSLFWWNKHQITQGENSL